METQFVIPAKNLKVFSKIVQCMAKIGDDLFFDVTLDKVLAIQINYKLEKNNKYKSNINQI